MAKIIDEEKLFDAVLKVLAARGYDGATTKGMADAAGINEVTLFRRYGNKANLIIQAARYQLEVMPFLVVETTGDIESDLMNFLQNFVQVNQVYGGLVTTFLFEIPRHPELAEISGFIIGSLQPVIVMMQEYQTQGVLREGSAFDAVGALLAPLLLYEMFQSMTPDFPIPRPDLTLHVDTFLKGYMA